MSAPGRFCCKSRLQRIGPLCLSLGGRGFDALALTLLRNSNATRCIESCGWRQGDQRCEPSQVLSDGGQNKLILGTTRATQSQPTEPQDALQVCEPHLDLVALPSAVLAFENLIHVVRGPSGRREASENDDP
jgi:hypothetical protein